MDLNDAADMRDEAEQAFNDARKTRGKRDLLYVAAMACVIVMLTGATTRTSWDALTPGKHSDHDFYPRYRKRDTWKQ